MSSGTPDGATAACHDLLVELAGRLPDELLWRLRDWLAATASEPNGVGGSRDLVSLMLPRELMRHRIGLTDRERDLLSDTAAGWGPARRLLDAVLPVHVPDELAYTFDADPEPTDAAALSVLAVVRGHWGCTQLSLARRTGGHVEQRVVLVCGGDRPWALAATLQRVLRAHGDRTPCVEVLPPHRANDDEQRGATTQISAASDSDLPPYHRAAATAAVTLWRGADVRAGDLVGADS